MGDAILAIGIIIMFLIVHALSYLVFGAMIAGLLWFVFGSSLTILQGAGLVMLLHIIGNIFGRRG